MGRRHALVWLKAILLGVVMASALAFLVTNLRSHQDTPGSTTTDSSETLYEVKSVIDGDTIKIDYDGKETSVRLIGVNTPETVDPRTTVQCFGEEASNYLKGLLTGKKVRIEPDDSQTDRDKYSRLLRYVYLDGEDVGYKIISGGYGYEYRYDVPYTKQVLYKEAQEDADKNKRGLWADDVCTADEEVDEKNNQKEDGKQAVDSKEQSTSSADSTTNSSTSDSAANCNIKGNISSSGERIYHVPGQKYYNSTRIDTSAGERWFCSEAEAQSAGWRKSKV